MATRLTEEDLVLNIIVNGNKAQSEVGQLGRTIQDTKAKLSAAESEMKKLEKAGKTNSTQYKKLEKDAKQYNIVLNDSRNRLDKLNQSMKLEDQTIKQLRVSLRKLSTLRDQSVPGTKQYENYQKQINAVSSRLTELRVGAQQTGRSLINMSGGLNKYISTAVGGVASMVAITSGINKAKREFAEFDDVVSDVMKTTNLAKDEVKDLDQALRDITTRTSDEDLLGLGRIAGKLGYTDAAEIQDFIGATNQIVVALNQDLGGDVEGTVNKIGKLIDIFKLKDIYDTEDAFLKVGSAINELGMASTANEGYLVEFARRMAGIGPLAKVDIDEILGLAATLDQLGQTSEVSSTALQKLFLDLAKNAEVYSKYAGLSVDEFRKLLEDDFMGAFTKVMQGVGDSSDGINELAATLGDLGQDGGRIIGVIGSLANNVHIMENQFKIANTAMKDGTSITEEYRIKNENAAAQLEIQRKEVNRLWRELGEKLWPVITSGNKLLVIFLDALKSIIGFLYDNRKIIGLLAVSIATYTVALNAATIATYAKSKATGIATVAMRIFNTVLRANPIGILVTVLGTAASAMLIFKDNTDSATKANREFEKSKKDIIAQATIETSAIQRNLEIIQDRTIEENKRLAAIKNLRDIMPDVLKDYSDEQVLIGEATKAIKEQIKERIKLATVRGYESKLDDLAKKRIDLEDQLERGQKGATFKERWGTLRESITDWSKSYEDIVNERLDTVKIQEERFANEMLKLQTELATIVSFEFPEGGGGGKGNNDGDPDPLGTGGGGKVTQDSKQKERLLENERKYWDDILSTQQEGYNRELHALDKRYEESLKLTELSEEEKTKISEIYLAERTRILSDVELKNNKEHREKLKRQWQQSYDAELADLDKYYLDRLEKINESSKTEEEKELEKIALQEEIERKTKEVDDQMLNTRLLNLQAQIEMGDMEIEERQRVADEINNILKNQVDNAISETERELEERLELERELEQSLYDVKIETAKAYESAFGIIGGLFSENVELANAFLVLEKAAAAAAVIINLQKELAVYSYRGSIGPIASAINAARITKAKIRAGISLATIAGTTISGVISNSKKSSNSVSGRESGGFFDVRREQDGRMFRSRYNPTQRGYVNRPTVLVGENGREWVASAQALANPDVSRIISVLDTAQNQGAISTLKLRDILSESGMMASMPGRNTGGHFSGGRTNESVTVSMAEAEKLTEVIAQLSGILERGIHSEISLTGRRGLQEKQRRLERIQKNANL